MPTREEKIAFIQQQVASSGAPAKTREEKIAFIQAKALGQPEPTFAPEPGFGEKVARGALRTLPAIGAIGAGLLATPESLGLATVPAAAAGAMAGKSLQNSLEKYLFDEGPQTRKEQYVGLAQEGLAGASAEMGGQAIAAVPGLIKSGISATKNAISKKLGPNLEYTPIANKDVILKAADKLGVELPRGVLTDNPTFQKLESGLSQSGSFPAKKVREQYNNLNKGLDAAAEKIAGLRTPESDFSIGKSIQKDLSDQVNANKAPVKELYGKVTPDLQRIPVDERTVNKVFGQLKKDPIFQTQEGLKFLEEHKQIVSQSPELASLKELRSGLRDLVNEQSLPVDQKRVAALQKAVTSIRDNSIEALKTGLPKKAHAEIDNLLSEISLADSAHAANIKDINSIKSVVGNKDFGSPSSFLNKLANTKEADLSQKSSNLDVETLRNLQTKFPSVFQKAKAAKINDMVQGSSNAASGFSDTRFIKQYDGLDKEMKDLIFSPEMQSHIDSLRTLKQAIPAKLGPSGTPEGLMTMDMFNPKRNALDFGIKKVLDSTGQMKVPEAGLNKSAAEIVPFGSRLQTVQALRGSNSNSSFEGMPRAAEKEEPTKGPAKWVQDGIEKVKNHDSSGAFLDPEIINRIKETKSGRDFLIKASDLKPGTRAMSNAVSGWLEKTISNKDNESIKAFIDSPSPYPKTPGNVFREFLGLKQMTKEDIAEWERNAPMEMGMAGMGSIGVVGKGAMGNVSLELMNMLKKKGLVSPQTVGAVERSALKGTGKYAEQAVPPEGYAPDQMQELIKYQAMQLPRLSNKQVTKIKDTSQPEWVDSFLKRFGDDSTKAEAALSDAGKSAHPYAHSDALSGMPTIPNKNFKITEDMQQIGQPGISQPHYGKNIEPLPWMDDKYKVLKSALMESKHPVKINTSSDLIAKSDYIDALPAGSEINMYALTKNADINRTLFPGNPSQLRLDKAVEKLKEAGVKVNVIQPTAETIMDSLVKRKGLKFAHGENGEELLKIVKSGSVKDLEKFLLENDALPKIKLVTGPEKWAEDGIKKIQAHEEINPALIEKLKSSKNGLKLLVLASDLKPGTKAMDNLVEKITNGAE